MKTIIVDDDPNCILALHGILSKYCSQVQVCATCNGIQDAVNNIQKFQPDFIFLDVELQNETGFDLFKHFPSPTFEVVFTTAHSKYAIKAIKSSCFDYLLKPIDIDELTRTIERLFEQKKRELPAQLIENLIENFNHINSGVQKIAIPSNEGFRFISTQDIVCLEADAKYTTVYTNNQQRIVSSKNIGEYEELLDTKLFFRLHKSWMINLNHVERYNKNDSQVLMTNGMLVDLSTRKKDDFMRLFNRM